MSLFGNIGNIAKIAGTAVGAYFGGPGGAAIGSTAGDVLSGIVDKSSNKTSSTGSFDIGNLLSGVSNSTTTGNALQFAQSLLGNSTTDATGEDSNFDLSSLANLFAKFLSFFGSSAS